MFSESYSKQSCCILSFESFESFESFFCAVGICGTRLQWLAQQMHHAIEHGLPKLALWSTHDSNLVHLRTSWHTMQIYAKLCKSILDVCLGIFALLAAAMCYQLLSVLTICQCVANWQKLVQVFMPAHVCPFSCIPVLFGSCSACRCSVCSTAMFRHVSQPPAPPRYHDLPSKRAPCVGRCARKLGDLRTSGAANHGAP